MMIRSAVLAVTLAAASSTGWAQEPAAAAPTYAERDFSVGQGDAALPGTLAMPEGEGPFPAVVLVHGSGPSDRNGKVGPNHPLRDIAQGLAERGVAVLRYDKRTLVHAAAALANPDFGVDDETTNDAVAAVAALQATAGIDPARVFVFGHSLGAIAAPRIVQRADGAAGGIMFAAAARPMLDLIPEQIARMGELRGADPATTSATLDRINDATARVRAGQDVPVLGVPAAYWRSTEALDPVAGAQALSQPLLILHGGRDIQVTDVDWQAWEAAFGDDPRVTLKRYPDLGHLGIVSDVDNPLATYGTPGHVDQALIDDAAAWIAEQ